MNTEQRVVTDNDRRIRLAEFTAQARDEENDEAAKRRQNKGFVQVYPKGFRRLRALMREYPLAAQLYAFFAEHIDAGIGAVVASQELLAQEMGVSRRSIIRATSWLDENDVVIRVRLGATAVYAYCLNPEEVWRSFDEAKNYAAFHTKTLARVSDNGDIKRRLQILLKGRCESE